MKYAGKVFYLRIKRIATRGVWTFHTAAQLLPSSCSKYLSTITVTCPGREATGWTFTVSIPPLSLVEVEVEDVLRTGKCLVMTEAVMQGVMTVSHDNKGTLFNVSVQIVDTDL